MVWIGFVWLRILTSGGLFSMNGNEFLYSIKCWEALE
jgi:hypothetical protein